MHKPLVLLFVAAALPLSGAALADMNYSYIQADLLGAHLGSEFNGISGAGVGLQGSAGIGSHLFGFAGYGNARYAGDGVKFRFVPVSLGLGAHVSLSPTINLFGGASVERLRVKKGLVGYGGYTESESFDGWGVDIGLRGWIGESFQWNAGVKHRDLKDLQALTSITAGGRYFFSARFSLGMEFTYQKYDNQFLLARDSVGSLNFRYGFRSDN